MREYILLFRGKYLEDDLSGGEPIDIMEAWRNWFAGIPPENRGDHGSRLSVSRSCTVWPDNLVTEMPVTDNGEFVQGYTVLVAKHIDELIGMSKSCPILLSGGSVEIRAFNTMDDNS